MSTLLAFIDNLSENFALVRAYWENGNFCCRLSRIVAPGKTTPNMPLARLVFSGWPFSNREILYSIATNSNVFLVKLRICRDGPGVWAFFDFASRSAELHSVTPKFTTKHDGFRVEVNSVDGVDVGDYIDLNFQFFPAEKIDLFKPQIPDVGDNGSYKTNPRILVIDSTPIGHVSATGQIKKMFLEKWHPDSILQIWQSSGGESNICLYKVGQDIGAARNSKLSRPEIIERCKQFSPDVVYFRPIDSEALFDITQEVLQVTKSSLMVHIMDDWPERLIFDGNQELHGALDGKLRGLLQQASTRLSICREMSDVYERRYGGDWFPLANGVDISNFPRKNWGIRPSPSSANPFVVRYMGALADDLNFDSICDIARVISQIGKQYHVVFEIYTMPWYLDKAKMEFSDYANVFVHGLVNEDVYAEKICSADAIVITYNFDSRSYAYIGLSLANKLPECLATGVPILAYGPMKVATISTIFDLHCAKVVSVRDDSVLRNGLLSLINDFSECNRLGEYGRKLAEERFAKDVVQAKFLLSCAAAAGKMSYVNDGSSRSKNIRTLQIRPLADSLPAVCCAKDSSSDQIKVRRWIFAFEMPRPTAGKRIVAGLALRSDQAVKARITLARHGDYAYEGNSIDIDLPSGNVINNYLICDFINDHCRLKIQLEIIGGSDDHFSNLEFIDFYLLKSLHDAVTPSLPHGITFKEANEAFRRCDYLFSLYAYAALYRDVEFDIYRNNAVMSALKLKMDAINNTKFFTDFINA